LETRELLLINLKGKKNSIASWRWQRRKGQNKGVKKKDAYQRNERGGETSKGKSLPEERKKWGTDSVGRGGVKKPRPQK